MFASVMVPAVLYASLLAVWGIDAHHRMAGALGALVAGLTVWGLQEAYRWHIIKDSLWTGMTVHAFNAAVILVPVTLLALAWGLARRRGRIWLLGVAVAPVLAGIDHERMLRWWGSLYFQAGDWAVPSAGFLGPVVAACLVCWLLEVSTRPSRTQSG
jgi:hypothetical protein